MPQIIVLLMIIAIVGLFKKRFRKWAFLLLCVTFVAAYFEQTKRDKAAQEAGFLNHQDQLDAQRAGITAPEEWATARKQAEADAQRQQEQMRLADACGDKHASAAFVMSQRYVLQALKAPSTADFPSILSVSVRPGENCTYIVDAYVDAQNGFGAQIRTNYRAVMRKDPEREAWSLVELLM